MPDGPLIDVAELARLLAHAAETAGDARPPALLDVRWDLQQGPRPDRYAEAHIPGAAFVDLDTALAAPHGDGRRGRHPLPDPETFAAAMRAAGVDSDRPVVVYDDAGGTIAARAWWLLRFHGHGDVRLLDGGLPAWQASGGAVATGDEQLVPGSFAVSQASGQMSTLDADGAAALAGTGVLLDARQAERYRGEVEPVDPAAGHIPGARHRSTRDNVGADGRFLTPERLADAFARRGASPGATVGVYCGSGVTAAHEVLALELAGIEASLYPGSWSEWCSDPARPVATGDTP